MVSLRGWLEIDGDGRPRMTKSQLDLVTRSISEILRRHATAVGNRETVTTEIEVRKFVSRAIAEYPADRSCLTCDFLHGGSCQSWGEVVPEAALESGCDRWSDDDVPF